MSLEERFDVTLEAAREGVPSALADLYRDLYPGVLRYLRTMDRNEGEDLASDVWLDVARGLNRFEGDERAFRRWVFSIARRRLIDLRRCRARRATFPASVEHLETRAETGDVEDEAMDALSTEAALARIAALPPDQAEVILLRVLGGLPVKEVAAIMGKRAGAVGALQHRALRRLARGRTEMMSPDDVLGEMRVLRLDDRTADRILSRLVDPDDAPPGYAEVTRLIRSMSGRPTERELSRQGEAVALAQRVTRAEHEHASEQSRRPAVRKSIRAKVVGMVVAGSILGTSGLALAGVLPGPAQDALSRVFSKVGVSVPTSQPAGTHPASTGSDISGIATTTETTGVAKGQLISSTASGGMSRAGQHGGSAGSKGSSTVPVTTPNGGGTGTADTVSGGSSDPGASTADSSSQGRSVEGSGNATGHPGP